MPNPVDKRIQAFQQQTRMQAGSLIVSVFGDAVHPRGGVVWLGCLIRMLEPLALNDRLIRTAIYRLVQDDWLTTQTQGRKTDYALSDTGRMRVEEASKLIYSGGASKWDSKWRMILTNADWPAHARAALRRALYWHGFGEWNAHAFLHPSADLKQVLQTLQAEGVLNKSTNLVTLLSPLLPTPWTISHQQVVAQAWDLKHLGRGYVAFSKQYQPVLAYLQKNQVPNQSAFLLRILLVHDFRRLLLRDPMLPSALLPVHWPGSQARLLFNKLYAAVQKASEQYLDEHFQTADQTTPARGTVVSKRIAAMRGRSKF